MSDSAQFHELAVSEQGGVYLVSTLSGSHYMLDFDRMTVQRTPDPDDEDEEKNLRKDGDELHLFGVTEIAVGSGMVLLLDVRGDGIPTRRWTTWVTRIERLA
jgi:hypothetical protein